MSVHQTYCLRMPQYDPRHGHHHRQCTFGNGFIPKIFVYILQIDEKASEQNNINFMIIVRV